MAPAKLFSRLSRDVIYVMYSNKQIDSMLACVYSVCSVIDQWWRQNVVKTKKWHTSRRRVCHWCFDLIFDVFCDLLLNRPTATWNLFVLYNDRKRKKTDTHTCLVPLDCSRICASLGNFSQTLLFVSASSFFVILITYSFLEEFFKVFSCSTHGENILQNRESLVATTHDARWQLLRRFLVV